MEDTKKPINKQMTESDKFKMMSKFSKGLTLWGSNKWKMYSKMLYKCYNVEYTSITIKKEVM